jgi:oligopeptide transport system ATP-binding protein
MENASLMQNAPLMEPPVLECTDLSVAFATPDGVVRAVNDLNLTVGRGECLGVVGESGSGKSQAFMAVMGLLAENGRATGSVRLQGEEILNAPKSVLNRYRGSQMAVIFQDPMSSLTPFLRIGDQMIEGLVQHERMDRDAARARALEMLELVRIPAARRRFRQYPHELSGGMRQRVMIAQALLCKPALVIADEPTTALDVTVQAEILEIFEGLKNHTSTALVLITHDLGIVAGLCDRVAVMYGGRIVEEACAEDIFYRPHHPYTQGLLRSIPTIDSDPDLELEVIPGQPPTLNAMPPGCHFSARCAHVMPVCRETPPPLETSPLGRRRACYLEMLT